METTNLIEALALLRERINQDTPITGKELKILVKPLITNPHQEAYINKLSDNQRIPNKLLNQIKKLL